MFCWLQCEENVHFAGFVLDRTECLDEMAVFQILQNLVQNRLCKFRSVSQIPCPDSYDPSLSLSPPFLPSTRVARLFDGLVNENIFRGQTSKSKSFET